MNRNGNEIPLLAIYFIETVKSFMCNFHRKPGAAQIMITEALLVMRISWKKQNLLLLLVWVIQEGSHCESWLNKWCNIVQASSTLRCGQQHFGEKVGNPSYIYFWPLKAPLFFPAGMLALACWSQSTFVKCVIQSNVAAEFFSIS